MFILHLTDAHFGQRGNRAYALGAQREFFDDVRHLIGTGADPDLILFSGDIANKGLYAEFVLAQEFLEKVTAEMGREVPLLLVPGNHDLVRPEDSSPVVQLLRANPDPVVQQLEHAYANALTNDYRSTVEGAFAAYQSWQDALPSRSSAWQPGLLPGDGMAVIEAPEGTLAVLALNTSILQLSDATREGSLALLETQVDALAQMALEQRDADAYILMTHHPAEWLDARSRALLEDGLMAALPVSLHIFGHRHVAEFTSLGRGADPRLIHRLQGRSYFGQEYLADGSTRRELGYAMLDVDLANGTLRVAPRRATARPAGGVTFEPERSRAWYLPKGSDWTDQVHLRPREDANHPKLPGPPAAPSPPTPSPTDITRLSEFTRDLAPLLEHVDMRAWRSPPSAARVVRNHASLVRLLSPADGLTEAERAYAWAVVLLVRSRADFALTFRSFDEFLNASDWAHEVADITTSHERLISRATDVAASAETRAVLGEWLLRRALGRSARVWDAPAARAAARRLAAALEARPSHVDALVGRLLDDAVGVTTGALTNDRLRESWALGYTGPDDPSHIRNAKVLPFAIVLASLEFDPITDGSELVEQVGIVDGFTLDELQRDIESSEWIVTDEGRLALVATCFDPAVEVAFQGFVVRLERLGSQLRAASSDAGLSSILESQLVTDLSPRRDGDRQSYTTPVTRLVMNTERIRSLLMGEQLYGESRLAIRELYQNALDACRYRELRHKYLVRSGQLAPSTWEPRIAFRACYDEHGSVPILECADSGVGMSRETLADCFLSAGTRFVETASFADEQAHWLACGDDLRLYPNSTFGIGAYSYFMLADSVEVLTRPEEPDGALGDGLRLQINAGSSVARVTAWPEARAELPEGGTVVRLHLRPEFRSTSRLQLSNFLDEVVLLSPFRVEVEEGHEQQERGAGDFSPEVPPPLSLAWSSGSSSAWWRIGDGPLLADGVRTPVSMVGLMVNLHGDKKPVLRVDRNAVVNWDDEWVLDNTSRSAEELANWDGLSLAWLWSFAERYPVHGQRLYEALTELRTIVPLGQSRLWEEDVDLQVVGGFPGDRYLLRELHDQRWESEYQEILIPKITRRTNRWDRLTVRFPACLRPWRRRVWLDALPQLFEGWEPDARDLGWLRPQTMAGASDGVAPVWEPERLDGLDSPGPLDAMLLASQPSLLDVHFDHGAAGHTEFADVVALVHTSYRCGMTLGDTVEQLSKFARFGLRSIPVVTPKGSSYTATLQDCRVVAALGRAWPATRELQRADLLSLVPVCQEQGLTVDEALDIARRLLRHLGIQVPMPTGRREAFRGHVPSPREVRFLGFGEYDGGRELRFGRGTRGAVVRAQRRGDMRGAEVHAVVRRYGGFGLSKYRPVLKAMKFRPEDRNHLTAWSSEFDSRPPWVDEETFRRGFISDRPSSHEELVRHAVFYAVLAEVPLQEAINLVLRFPGLTDEQRGDASIVVGDVKVDERDLEVLRDRIGETSHYENRRFGGIGQADLVLRPWSIIELKAAARATNATLEEIYERLGKFSFLGVVLPDAGPETLASYELSELETELLTSQDHSLTQFDGGSPFREGPKPITVPIPTQHVMVVAHSQKLGLGEVVDALNELRSLGVRSDVMSVPSELREFLPSATDVALAGRLTPVSVAYGLLEHAFSTGHTVGYVCDLVSPWLGWKLGRDCTAELEALTVAIGDLQPTYSDVSFVAAAAAHARQAEGVFTPIGACVLAAQANVDIGTVADLAERMQSVLDVDGWTVDMNQLDDAGRAIVPDSSWVLAADPTGIAGRRTPRGYLGLTSSFVSDVRRRLGVEG
jgi:predicted MPP superfamily phosphohydrolase